MDMTMLITIVTAVLASTGLWSIVLYFIQKRDKKKEEETSGDNAERQMLMALAHDRLYYLLGNIIEEYQTGARNGILKDEFQNIQILYESYKALGGNGVCERMFNEVQSIPFVAYKEDI